jgi:hypothetical protein
MHKARIFPLLQLQQVTPYISMYYMQIPPEFFILVKHGPT